VLPTDLPGLLAFFVIVLAANGRIPIDSHGGSGTPQGRCGDPGPRRAAAARSGGEMTQQYLVGELSVRLEQLQAATANDVARDVARLRHQVETGPLTQLAPAAARALALADGLCWNSLSSGDMAAFTRQARISADLRLFGVCARLLADG
jgi:hypothetical protein